MDKENSKGKHLTFIVLILLLIYILGLMHF